MANIVLRSWNPPVPNSIGSLESTSCTGRGETFFNSECDYKVVSAQFNLKKTLAPTGNANAVIYLATGSIDALNTSTGVADSHTSGSALATSDNFDVSTLTTTSQWITFPFSGVNQITLAAGTMYALILEYLGGDATNTVDMSYTNGGNHYVYGFGANISRGTFPSAYTGQAQFTDALFILTVEDYPKTGNVLVQNLRPSIFSPGVGR
jgi:hypothetical protein